MKFNRAHEIGYQMGEETGRQEGKLEAITNLMTNLHMSVEKALDAIGIPEPEWNEYIEKIDCKDEHVIA